MWVRGEFHDQAHNPNDSSQPRSEQDEALAAFGLQPAATAGNVLQEFWLWPEHEPALLLWAAVQTQWRTGMAGATGLDYAGVRASPAFVALQRRQRERVFADVCTMERAALTEWQEQRQRARR